jgi:hypothetical protein
MATATRSLPTVRSLANEYGVSTRPRGESFAVAHPGSAQPPRDAAVGNKIRGSSKLAGMALWREYCPRPVVVTERACLRGARADAAFGPRETGVTGAST